MQELGLTHVDGSILYRDLTKMKFVVFVLCVIPLVTCLHVTPEPPTLECGFVYCSSDEFCDIIIGCSACAIICQPDISNTECQKQCPGFIVPPVTTPSPAKKFRREPAHKLPPNHPPDDPLPLASQHDQPAGYSMPFVVPITCLFAASLVTVLLGVLVYKHRTIQRPTSEAIQRRPSSVDLDNGIEMTPLAEDGSTPDDSNRYLSGRGHTVQQPTEDQASDQSM